MDTMAQDPVCGMEVNTATTSEQSDYEGQTYYFCSEECKNAFDAEPEKYVGEVDIPTNL
jgi:YHS domain-containing protein